MLLTFVFFLISYEYSLDTQVFKLILIILKKKLQVIWMIPSDKHSSLIISESLIIDILMMYIWGTSLIRKKYSLIEPNVVIHSSWSLAVWLYSYTVTCFSACLLNLLRSLMRPLSHSEGKAVWSFGENFFPFWWK